MATYIYYCARCRSTFEVESEHPEGEPAPPMPCPACGNPEALKAFSAGDLKPSGGCCEPASGP